MKNALIILVHSISLTFAFIKLNMELLYNDFQFHTSLILVISFDANGKR